MADTRSLKIEILGDSKDASRAIDRISRDLNNMGGVAGFAAGAAKAGFAVIGAASLAAGAGVAYSVNLFRDFEQSLNVFQEVSQASNRQMGEMSKLAKQLGADVKLPGTSAKDAADAMTELAKGGLSVNQVMGATRGVLQLAAAAQIGNAEAAAIAANALNAFGLKGEEANRVADLLAGASAAAQGEITDMAQAMAQASAVFASNKVPIEDLTTEISLMAKAGILGSDAGTSLRTMMLRLSAPTDVAAAKLKDLGISVYDAGGQMRSQRDIIGQFEKATKGMTDAQRNAAFQTIFGTDAIRAANIVLAAGVEKFDKMKEAVTRQGAAADLAAAKNKGLTGQIDAIRSTLETWAITIGEKLAPVVVEGFLKIQQAVDYLAPGIADFAGKVGAAWPDIASKIAKAVPEIIDRLVNFGRTLYRDIIEPVARVGESLGRMTAQLAQALGPALLTAIGALGIAAYKAVSGGLQVLADALEFLSRHSFVVIPAITGLATAFVALKVVSTVAPMIENLRYQFALFQGTMANQGGGVMGAVKALVPALVAINPVALGVTAAVGAATFAWMKHQESQRQSKERVDALTDAMQRQTGALQSNVQAALLAELQDKNRMDDLRELGISTRTYTEAALGNADAQDSLRQSTAEYLAENGKLPGDLQRTLIALGQSTSESAKAAQATIDLAVAEGKLTEQMAKDIEAKHRNKDGSINYGAALDEVKRVTGETTDETDRATDAVDALKDAWDRATGKAPELLAAQNDYKLGLIDLNKFVDENKGKLAEGSEAGLQYSNMLLDQKGKAEDIATAMLGMGQSHQDVRVHLQNVAADLAENMRQAGYTEEQIKHLQRTIGLTDEQIEIVATAKVDPAIAELERLQMRLIGLQSRFAALSIQANSPAWQATFRILAGAHAIPGRAAGGPVKAQGAYLVGEEGPELFVPDKSGNIIPNAVSAPRGTAYMGAPSSAPTIQLHLEVHGSVMTERELTSAVYDGLLEIEKDNGYLWNRRAS